MDKAWVFITSPFTFTCFNFHTLSLPNPPIFTSRRPKSFSSSSSLKAIPLSNSNDKYEDLELVSTKVCSDGSILFRFGDSSEIEIDDQGLEEKVELNHTHFVIDPCTDNVVETVSEYSCYKENNFEEFYLLGEVCEEGNDVEKQLSSNVDFDVQNNDAVSQLSSSEEDFVHFSDAAKGQNLDTVTNGEGDLEYNVVRVIQEMEPFLMAEETSLDGRVEDPTADKLGIEGLKPVDESEPSDAMIKITDEEHSNSIIEVLVPSEVELQSAGTNSNSDELEEITDDVRSSSMTEEPAHGGVESQTIETDFNTDVMEKITNDVVLSSDPLEEINKDIKKSNVTVEPVPLSNGAELLSVGTCLNSNTFQEVPAPSEAELQSVETFPNSDDLEEIITDTDQSGNYKEAPVPCAAELECIRTLNFDTLEEIIDAKQNSNATEVSVPIAPESQFIETPLKSDALEEIINAKQNSNTTEVSVPSAPELQSIETPLNSNGLEEISGNTTDVLVHSVAELQSIDTPLNSDGLEEISGDQQYKEEILVTGIFLDSSTASLPHPHKELSGGGGDPYFVTYNWLGVTESVGHWSFEGTSSGLYAQELIESCKENVSDQKSNPVNCPVDLLKRSAAGILCPGSTTVLVAYFDGQTLHAANIGDSGFIIVRNGSILKKSSPMFHEFGFPLRIEKGVDPSEFIEEYKIDLYYGDVLITATDGLFDNLYEQEIAYLVSSALQAGSNPREIAELLATRSQEVGRSVSGRTPFADAAQGAGCIGCTGGRLDDVTVIVSVVQKRFTN